MFASLVTLDGFHQLLSTQLTADLTQEWSGGSTLHPLSRLHKNSILLCWNSSKQRFESSICCCFWSTVSKCGTNSEHSFLIDKCLCKIVNTLPSDIFNSSAISCNFNLQSAKTSWVFLVFSRTAAKFGWPECSASFMAVRPCLKSPYHHCLQWSKVRITLIKPFLSCTNFFPPCQETILYQHTKIRFFIVLKICNSSFT